MHLSKNAKRTQSSKIAKYQVHLSRLYAGFFVPPNSRQSETSTPKPAIPLHFSNTWHAKNRHLLHPHYSILTPATKTVSRESAALKKTTWRTNLPPLYRYHTFCLTSHRIIAGKPPFLQLVNDQQVLQAHLQFRSRTVGVRQAIMAGRGRPENQAIFPVDRSNGATHWPNDRLVPMTPGASCTAIADNRTRCD
jgi:hypothetical protein